MSKLPRAFVTVPSYCHYCYAAILLSFALTPSGTGLSSTYYSQSCPRLHSVVSKTVQTWISSDVTKGPQLIRLLFHDCFVQGCDASIMLNGTTNNPSEMTAIPNLTVDGLQVIADLKKRMENWCPKTVSCADLIVYAAREALYITGGPYVDVKFGRFDSVNYSLNGTNKLPSPFSNTTVNLGIFQSKNLTTLDFVALSGAHTIGQGRCSRIKQRLDTQDRSMDRQYRRDLYYICGGKKFNGTILLNNDNVTSTLFDNQYFINLQARKGLFTSDQDMTLDKGTQGIVSSFAADQSFFFQQFATSFIKMTEMGVLTGPPGQIRKVCNSINPV